jgi:hypothetical protein
MRRRRRVHQRDEASVRLTLVHMTLPYSRTVMRLNYSCMAGLGRLAKPPQAASLPHN